MVVGIFAINTTPLETNLMNKTLFIFACKI